MEQRSTQKRVHPARTQVACAILLIIALLLSFQLAYSKSHRWDELLQLEFAVDAELTLIVPASWRLDASTPSDEVLLRGELSGMAGEYELRVLRPSRAGSGSFHAVRERILVARGATIGLTALPPVACLLDQQSVVMEGFEWLSADGHPVNLRALVAEDADGRVTALALRVVGGNDDDVRGLLRRIAAQATFRATG